MINLFVNDMYSMANAGDIDGFMTGVTLVLLYGLAIVLGIANFLNKRG